MPGFGATPTPEHTLTVAEQATYILGALEQLGVLEFVVVGHSMGTQFAVEAARQQPSRIRHVVLMGPVVNDQRRTVAQQALALGRDCLFFESPSSNALVFTDYLRCGPSWYLKNLRIMMDYRLEERIGGRGRPGPRAARRERPRGAGGLVPPARRPGEPGRPVPRNRREPGTWSNTTAPSRLPTPSSPSPALQPTKAKRRKGSTA